MTTRRPETLARALLRLLEDNPKDIRARTPVPFVFIAHDQMEENRRKYLAQRSVVEGIASLRIDGLTRASRLLEVEAMRKWAGVSVADLGSAYDELAAQEDERTAGLEAWIAAARADLGPGWRPFVAETRRIPETVYGPAPVVVPMWSPVCDAPPLADDEMIGLVDLEDPCREYDPMDSVESA